jgi:GntR family histidine utilization transcriptional repressor
MQRRALKTRRSESGRVAHSAFVEGAGPRYRQVQRYIRSRIESGEWSPDHRVPTEHELVSLFGVSRMTVHRALRELTDQGMLRRLPGAGTFVADPTPRSDLLQIRNIADEIEARGHVHTSEVRVLRAERAERRVAVALGVAPAAKVFHSVIVHLENAWPIQIEERYVNPAFAPGYLAQDFAATTPNAYLTRCGPVDRAEHTIEAVRPPREAQRLLRIPADEPCLLLHRRTWSGGLVVSQARLTHPGSRYRLGAQFAGPR